jgi:hypothetical protein
MNRLSQTDPATLSILLVGLSEGILFFFYCLVFCMEIKATLCYHFVTSMKTTSHSALFSRELLSCFIPSLQHYKTLVLSLLLCIRIGQE